MSCSAKVWRTFEFLHVFGSSEEGQGAAEKNKEKFEVNCTGSQSVEMFFYARKTKFQLLTTSSRSLTRIHQRLLKSLGLYHY